MSRSILKVTTAGVVAIVATLASATAVAKGSHNNNGEIGFKGDPVKVSRTINVTMFETYYEPGKLSIKEGQTVRFIITNKGETVHEFSIGTPEMHVAHQPEMAMMVEHGALEVDRINWEAAEAMQATMGHGMHEAANSILLEPGQTGELIWMFPEHAKLEFACNIPGHYDAGMVGKINLTH